MKPRLGSSQVHLIDTDTSCKTAVAIFHEKTLAKAKIGLKALHLRNTTQYSKIVQFFT